MNCTRTKITRVWRYATFVDSRRTVGKLKPKKVSCKCYLSRGRRRMVSTSQQMSDEHGRRATTMAGVQLHRTWIRAKNCDGCDRGDHDRGNIGGDGGGDQDDDDHGDDGRTTDRGEQRISAAASDRRVTPREKPARRGATTSERNRYKKEDENKGKKKP